MKKLIGFFLSIPFFCMASVQTLDVDIIEYDAFAAKTPEAMEQLQTALYKKGIVGIRGVPGYREKAEAYINALRTFSSFPMETKMKYSAKGLTEKAKHFVGYDVGAEKFRLPSGEWVVDDLKNSIYTIYPDMCENKWPVEVNLKTPFEEICAVVTDIGKTILEDIELISPKTGITRDSLAPHVCRQLHYAKTSNTEVNNPYWCGAHYDHGLFTGLLPAFYYTDGKEISEPMEAGLFVRPTGKNHFEKIVANDREVMLFQVGEFGQIISDDKIMATEHRVNKASGNVERFTIAIFFDTDHDYVVHSNSALTEDARYTGGRGSPCIFRDWHVNTLNRHATK